MWFACDKKKFSVYMMSFEDLMGKLWLGGEGETRGGASRRVKEITWELINILKNYGERNKVMSYVSYYVSGMLFYLINFPLCFLLKYLF